MAMNRVDVVNLVVDVVDADLDVDLVERDQSLRTRHLPNKQ